MSREAPDWLILDGRRRMLVNEPLESFLRNMSTRPDFEFHDGINTRGYVATWEAKPDDTLWLTSLMTRNANDGPELPDPGWRTVFSIPFGPIEATWVSQQLVSPDGERRFNPRGYASTYARETILTVYQGRIVSIADLHGGTGQRSSYRLTPHLEAIFGSEEAAFLRAVHADPKDSAPRLVYADWLEERGDQRADVIRVAERTRDPRLYVGDLRNELWIQLMGYEDFTAAFRSG